MNEVYGGWLSVSLPTTPNDEANVRAQMRECAVFNGFPDAEIWRGTPPDAWPESARPKPADGTEAWGWIATKEVIDAIH